MNYYIVNQYWIDHLIKCGGFLGHDAVKVQLSSAPDDGQKRVALTRGECEGLVHAGASACKSSFDEYVNDESMLEILNGYFGEEASR